MKSIILETLLVIIPIFSACVIVRYELNKGKSLEDITSILCMYLPASVGYWITKIKSNPQIIQIQKNRLEFGNI